MLAQFSIFPTDKGESLSVYVAEAIRIVDASGLPYKLGPMSTSIEGEWDQVFSVIKECRDAMRRHSNRVYIVIAADDRAGAVNRLQGKIRSVAEKLGHEPKV